jgi:hypothetical protein
MVFNGAFTVPVLASLPVVETYQVVAFTAAFDEGGTLLLEHVGRTLTASKRVRNILKIIA